MLRTEFAACAQSELQGEEPSFSWLLLGSRQGSAIGLRTAASPDSPMSPNLDPGSDSDLGLTTPPS